MLKNKQKEPQPQFELHFHPDVYSVTELSAPIYRKPMKIQSSFLQPSPQPFNAINQEVQLHYEQLNKTVNDISMFINNRMQVHEQQLLLIMKKQLSSMMELVNNTINKYQSKMLQNNIDEEIDLLKAEIQFFKLEALTLLEEKKTLEKELCVLKSRIKQFSEKQSTNKLVLQNIKAKLMKEKQKNSRQSKSMSTLDPPTNQTKGYKSTKGTDTTPSRFQETFLTNFDQRIDIKLNFDAKLNKIEQGSKKCKTQLNAQELIKQKQSEREFQEIGSTIPQLKTANAFHITRKNVNRDRNILKKNTKIEFK